MLVTAALALHLAVLDAPPAPPVHLVPRFTLAQGWDPSPPPPAPGGPPVATGGYAARTPMLGATLAAAAGMAGADLSLGGVLLIAVMAAMFTDSNGAEGFAIAAAVGLVFVPPALAVAAARGTVDYRAGFWGPYLAALAVRAAGWLAAGAIASASSGSGAGTSMLGALLLIDLVAVPLTIGWTVTGATARSSAPPDAPGAGWDPAPVTFAHPERDPAVALR